MKDQLKISEDHQQNLLAILKQQIPGQHAMVDVLSDLLNISQDAAYRRLRGEKRFDIDELFTICKTYNISLDNVFSVKSEGTLFNYTALDVRDHPNYLLYMQRMSKSIEMINAGHDREIIFSAVDIPSFHFMPYKELTLFKLFAWNNTVYGYEKDLLSFIKEIEDKELFNCYRKIFQDYSQIPSTEIWTVNTIDTIIRLLDFYFETGHFKDKELSLLICNQLLDLIANLKGWVEKGYKGNNPSSTFKFYVSEIDLENNFALFRRDNDIQCMIKLFTINSLATSDEAFCTETLNWLDTSIKRSVLLSGASERERFKYFNILQQKVRYIIDKFEKSQRRISPPDFPNPYINGSSL
jgi:hypothetical protein